MENTQPTTKASKLKLDLKIVNTQQVEEKPQ